MAVAARGGRDAIWREDEAERVIFHTDSGSTYTANAFTKLCRQQGTQQSMGRVGSCFDNADEARAVVLDWCYGFYNHDRRHSTAGMMSPVNYENTAAPVLEAA